MIKLLAVKLSLIPLFFLFLFPIDLQAQCENDITPPTCQAPNDVVIDCEDFYNLGPIVNNNQILDSMAFSTHFGVAIATDNCNAVIQENIVSQISDCGYGDIIRTFTAIDDAGNQSTGICKQTITIERNYVYQVVMPADLSPTDPVVDTLANTAIMSCEVIGQSYNDVIWDLDCDGTNDLIQREWFMINWCAFDSDPAVIIERDDIDGDGQDGDAFTIEIRNDSIFKILPNQSEVLITEDGPFIQYTQHIYLNEVEELEDITITGIVYNDVDSNCVRATQEEPLINWEVEVKGLITGTSLRTRTGSQGQYTVNLCNQDSIFEVRILSPYNVAGSCPSTYTLSVASTVDSVTQDLPAQLQEDCNLLSVDLSTPFLRRCFESNYYVSVCNLSADTTEDVYVEVELDAFLEFQSSSVPETYISGNLYSFDFPDLAPGACEQIRIKVLVSCDAELGQTHCTTAQVFPENDCFPISPQWSGASLELDAFCQGDSVQMRIKNVGTGNMETDGHYIVVEDVLMYGEGDFRLNSGETETVVLPANGATWALITDPVPFHPGTSMPRISIEGCGGLNIPGLTMAFGEDDANPDISIECQQNIGAYDPNDKRVSPAGYGDMHYTEANTDLEYHIRFQNTGTDTAFNIVVLDTLSSLLQAQTVRTGASSHPYNFELLEDGILKFSFENIMLPDSNINEPASHGFVKFRVEQVPDLEDGHVIENSAAIYFDFNEPVITNTTFNTIGREFIEEVTAVSDTQIPGFKLQIMPHPIGEVAQFKLEGVPIHNGQLLVYDLQGQLIKQQGFSSDTFLFGSRQLAKGIYFYRIQQDGIILSTGKLIIQ
jgi:uncharacterized repeat protein (TIGR01451 family)